MSGLNSTDEIERWKQENERLKRECAQNLQLMEQLRTELAETNRGVLALYAELDDRAESLREATALKSRFLSYMSHEFRTPLGSIRSIARILMDRMDGPLTSEQVKQIELIQDSAVELTEMVNDLLDLARIEAGRIVISPEWFEMVDLFSALRGMFKPLLGNSAVTLHLEEPVNLPPIYTDHKKLSQILRNYISNALKFTTEGEVRVSARRLDEENVHFAVADTGIGIPPEYQEKIFQDFVQVDSPLQKKLHGTGLGLSLSKKIAELLGGNVGMTSQPGVGSTFTVTIPICLGDPPERAEEADKTPDSEREFNV